MESETALPHSQEPAICPYSEPVQFIPCILHCTSWSSILISSSHLCVCLGFQVVSLAQVSTPKPVCPYPLLNMSYVPSQSHPSWLDHPNSFQQVVQIIKLLSLSSFLHSPLNSSLLDPNIFLSTLFSNTPSLRLSLNVSDQVSSRTKQLVKL
jgi:hypothetical protein